MNPQATFNFSVIPPSRRVGIALAEERANREIVDWSDLAAAFLRKYCRENESVFGEDVTKAAEAWGLISPSNPRAWGASYIRAQREGIIEKTDRTRRRENGSLAMVYRSLVFAKT